MGVRHEWRRKTGLEAISVISVLVETLAVGEILRIESMGVCSRMRSSGRGMLGF